MSKNEIDRRDFLKKSSKSLVILPLADATNRASANDADEVNSKFQPEEFRNERMESPDDGKKYGWFVDARRTSPHKPFRFPSGSSSTNVSRPDFGNCSRNV
ncbi:MAG: hypothetical protein CMJ77_08325 [Planctomycetaceae bacterium]|nr:hypothetical protein [Planctomycetaceae bacterium]